MRLPIVNPNTHRIPRLGLTGGIGSGKSTALAYLRELGAAVISSDAIVHGLYESPDIVRHVAERFGAEVVRDGVVDRGALARVAFANPQDLEWLEDLLHPHVRAAIVSWAVAAEESVPRPPLLAVEVPLLFESDFAADFDYTLVITAPAADRRRRLSSRFSEADLERRLAQQMPEEEKMARADFVFMNAGSRRELRAFLGETLAYILSATTVVEGG